MNNDIISITAPFVLIFALCLFAVLFALFVRAYFSVSDKVEENKNIPVIKLCERKAGFYTETNFEVF